MLMLILLLFCWKQLCFDAFTELGITLDWCRIFSFYFWNESWKSIINITKKFCSKSLKFSNHIPIRYPRLNLWAKKLEFKNGKSELKERRLHASVCVCMRVLEKPPPSPSFSQTTKPIISESNSGVIFWYQLINRNACLGFFRYEHIFWGEDSKKRNTGNKYYGMFYLTFLTG